MEEVQLSRHGRRPAWLTGELLVETQSTMQVYRLWKQGWGTLEEYRTAAKAC